MPRKKPKPKLTLQYDPRIHKVPTAWSYSALSAYEACPRNYFVTKVLKIKQEKNEGQWRGIKLHDKGAKFLAGETDDFPIEFAKFEDQMYELREFHPIVEQKWAFNAKWKSTGNFAKDVKCRMVLDVGLQYADRTAEAIDHKTGKYKPEDNEKYFDQMGLFAYGFTKMFPGTTHITTRLWYIDQDKEIIKEFTAQDAAMVGKDMERRASRILEDDRFAPRPNKGCYWCPIAKAKGGPCEFGG